VLSGLVKRHESLKKYIKTILDQLPQYIEAYPPEEQELLKEFLSILSHYEEAEFKRSELSNKFETYRQDIISRKNYPVLPFLCFLSTYFRNALVILNNSGFHAKLFYEYLIKHLRGSTQFQGVYGFIRKKVALFDLAWELLQYECSKLTSPLTSDQLQILNTVYSCRKELGVHTLDSKHLRFEVNEKSNQPLTVSELTRFFTLIEGKWFLHFFPPAFGLTRLSFRIQLIEPNELNDIINFQDPSNTVLCVSDVHAIRNSKNEYIGTFLIPTRCIDRFTEYILHHKEQSNLVIKNLSKIETSFRTTSLEIYEAGVGWKEPSKTKLNLLKTKLLSEKPRETYSNALSTLNIPQSFNSNWYYNQHPLPGKIIELYCRIPEAYSFIELPFRSLKSGNTKSLSRDEIGLLKQLYYNKVVNIGFVPWRMIYEFSLDRYCIEIPQKPILKLKQLLFLLPYSFTYITKDKIYIWAFLTPHLVNWIKNRLKWNIYPVIWTQQLQDLSFEWFNKTTLQWKIPRILL